MRRPLSPLALLVLGVALGLAAAPLRGQETLPSDAAVEADTLEAAFRDVGHDPRLTWLGDSLSAAETTPPKFSDLPEAWPDSVITIYTSDRPGRWAAWRMRGDALLGRGAFNLLDVLESELPVLAQDTGGSGLAAYMGSAEGTGTNVEVVIDGVPAGTPIEAAWDLRQIPLEAIAEVAWYPGPQVAAWGGTGTGGVLSITTRRSLARGARSMIGFLLGSFDAQAFSGTFARPVTRRGDVFVGANFDAMDGFVRSGDFTRNQTVARAGWRLGRDHRVEISRRGDGLSGRENRGAAAGQLTITGQEDHDATALHGFYRGGFGPVTARLHVQREKHEIDQAFDLGTGSAIVGTGEKEEVRGELEGRIGDRVVLWAGGARVDEDAESPAHPAFFVGGSNVLDPEDPAVPRIVPVVTTEIAAGAGFGRPDDAFAGNAAVRGVSFDDDRDGGVAWQAEALARPGGGLTLRAMAARALRPPDLIARAILLRLAGEGIEVHPGRAADPLAIETWTHWRGEVAWQGGEWSVAGRAWRSTGEDAFLWLPPTAWSRFDPTVESFPVGGLGLNAFDVVDLTKTAFEVDAKVPLPYGVQGVLRGRWLDETLDHTGGRVPYVPELQAIGQLRYARRFFPSRDLLVEGRLTGRLMGDRTTISGAELPAIFLTDLLVQATVINLTVYVSFKNLFAQEYETEEGFALPGSEGFLGISWRFRN